MRAVLGIMPENKAGDRGCQEKSVPDRIVAVPCYVIEKIADRGNFNDAAK